MIFFFFVFERRIGYGYNMYYLMRNESSQGSMMGVTLLETVNKLKIVMLKDININIYNSASCLSAPLIISCWNAADDYYVVLIILLSSPAAYLLKIEGIFREVHISRHHKISHTELHLLASNRVRTGLGSNILRHSCSIHETATTAVT